VQAVAAAGGKNFKLGLKYFDKELIEGEAAGKRGNLKTYNNF
jgi:hypothetical protein